MPTRASLIRAGVDPDELTSDRLCYVCKEPLSGYARRDTPTPKAARQGVTLGDRHKDCRPSEDAGESRKVMLSGRTAIAAD